MVAGAEAIAGIISTVHELPAYDRKNSLKILSVPFCMNSPSVFQDYLQSLRTTYEQWWEENAFIDEIKDTWFEFVLDGKTKSDEPANDLKRAGEQRQEITKPVLRLIEDYRNQKILIVGSPGAGKSTLLKRLLRDAAEKAQKDEQAPIPVLVELKNYRITGDRVGVRGLILESLESHDPALDEAALKQLLAGKRLLLLADGLNELSHEPAKAELTNLCRHQAIIATSRFANDWWNIDRKLEVQSLTPQQVKRFLEERLPNRDRAELEKLGDRVRDFGQTPLMVWMLYTIFQANKETPATRGEAYRSFTDLYIERAKTGLDLAESRFLLSRLAFEMMQSQKPNDPMHFSLEMTEVDAQNRLGSATVLNQLLNLHLLQASGKPGNRKIRFCHQSLQEYYAAEALLEQLQEHPEWLKKTPKQQWTQFQQDYLNYVKWTEAIALMLGLPEVNASYAKHVVKLGLDTDLMLGARLAGEVKLQVQEQTVELVNTIKQIDQIGTTTWLQVELLGRTQSKLALPKLQSLLRSSNLDIARRAATWIGFLGYQEAIPDLLQMLSELDRWIPHKDGSRVYSDRTLSLEIEIIEVLGKLSPKDAISKLREIFHAPTSFIYSFSQPKINKLLKKFDTEVTTKESLETLRTSKNSNQISHASGLLFEIGCLDTPSILISRLNCEQDAEIHKSLIDALAPFNTDGAIATLTSLILSKDIHLREKAARALIQYERVSAIDALISHLDNPDWNIRWCTAVVLGKLGSDAAAPILLDGLAGKYPRNIRITAAEVLGKLESDEVVRALISSLKDSDYGVRRSAAISLAYFNRQEAIPELLKALRHYYPPRNSCRDIETPFKLNEEETITIHEMTPEMLSQLGDDEAIQSWIFERIGVRLREQIADAVGRFNTEEVINGLFESLQEGVKAAAIPLGNLGKQEVVPDLLELLQNNSQISSGNKVIDTLVNLISKGALSVVDESFLILTNIKDYPDADFYFRNRVAIILAKAEHEAMPSYLSKLVTLLPSEVGEQASWAIESIQSRCGFYNYEIAQAKSHQSMKGRSEENLLHDKLDTLTQEVKKVSEEPKRVIHTQNYFEKGTHTHTHNYANDETLRQEITDLRQLVSQLQKNHRPTTEAEAIQVIDAEFHEIQKTNPSRWQAIQKQLHLLKSQLLNPERHLTASKAAISEVAKHYLEESVIAKALITYLDTMSADTDQGA